MPSALIPNPAGHYHFLQGIDPYSCGVVADPGFEIVRAVLIRPVPWREGFEMIDNYLRRSGLRRSALCAMELRSPAPFSMQGFIDYNRGYRAVLEEWGLLIEGMNPVARTNVAPVSNAMNGVELHAFSFVQPAVHPQKTFVVAGAGELREGILDSSGIIRCGENSEQATLEKAGYVLSVMEERLLGLGGDWGMVTCSNVYTTLQASDSLRELIRSKLQEASRFGANWHWTKPPVIDIEFEMDLRGVRSEIVV